VAAPYVYLTDIKAELANKTNFELGAQDCSIYNRSGAYTGEVSANMLFNIGCNYVIIGHSERRISFNENNQVVLDKLSQAVLSGLTPILCVGESLEIYQNDETTNYLNTQLKNIPYDILRKCIVAYEPIWAIGSGLIPTNQEISNSIEFIKSIAKTSVLYGGSVSKSNITELVKIKNCDGFLVGGASLKVTEFNHIITTI